jgi:serine/threonine protein kinase
MKNEERAGLRSLVEKLLTSDPEDRPSVSQVLRNSMFCDSVTMSKSTKTQIWTQGTQVMDESKCWYSVSVLHKQERVWDSCESLEDNSDHKFQSVQKYLNKQIFCSIHNCHAGPGRTGSPT